MVQPPPPSSLPPPRPRSSSTSGASLKGRADDACVEAMLDFLDLLEFFSKTESDTSDSGTVLPAFPGGEREEDEAASFEGWVEDKTEELLVLLLVALEYVFVAFVAFVAFVVFVAFVAFEFDDFDEK